MRKRKKTGDNTNSRRKTGGIGKKTEERRGGREGKANKRERCKKRQLDKNIEKEDGKIEVCAMGVCFARGKEITYIISL